MKRLTVVMIAAGCVLFLGGCAVDSMPSYDELAKQTKDSLQQIVDQMPAGTTATFRDEGKPYPCSDSTKRTGYFYTGEVDVVLPAGTDVRAVVSSLPARLGDSWQEMPSLKLSVPRAELRDKSTGVQVNVMGLSSPDAALSLYLNGISRCGMGPAK